LSDKADKRRINLTLTKFQAEFLDRLVDVGLYMDQTSAIRDALRLLIKEHGISPFYLEAEGK